MAENQNDSPFEEIDGMESYEQLAAEAAEEAERASQEPLISETEDQKIYGEKDLVKRARLLVAHQLLQWPHMKRIGDGMEIPNPRSDANRYEILRALFKDCETQDVPHPYFDTFRACAVDHFDEPISELTSHAEIIGRAMDAAGLKMVSYSQIDEAYKRFALAHKRNSLQDYFNKKCQEWDGIERLDESLIRLFKLRDTPLNRTVSRYFWFSLYNRINNPGCVATLSIALIGAQGVGKSYFSVQLCKILMGKPQAVSTSLNISDIERNLKDWLRKITGSSIIANMGEMRGYKKVDIETIKEFTGRSVDNFDQKWGSSFDTPRQWIIIADSNSYEGFNRDETGNRRFYPLFLNQIEDKDGQPAWGEPEDGWKIDYRNFEHEVWQLMAEVRHLMNIGGEKAYLELVNAAEAGVNRFTRDEMEQGRGVIKDEQTDVGLRNILLGMDMQILDKRSAQGVFVTASDIQLLWNKTQKFSLNFISVKRLMNAYGFQPKNVYGLGRGYLMEDVPSIKAAKYMIQTGRRKYHPDYLEEMSSDDLFNLALERALKRIQSIQDHF